MQIRIRTAVVLATAASSVALMGAPAFASYGPPDVSTSGDASFLSGNEVQVPISVPINLCGNAIAVIGIAGAGCEGGAAVFG
jgi:hypothetical protein